MTNQITDVAANRPDEPTTNQRVVIVGQGYVGLPLSMRAVEAGYDVIGFDLDKEKVSNLVTGRSYIDDITDVDIEQALVTARYQATTDVANLAGFDVAVITVPTPLTEGAPDISSIEAASHTLGKYLSPGSTVILESTTYPGTTSDVVAPILEHESGLRPGVDFFLGYSPERIDPGNTTWTLERTPKVVSGINEESLERVERFYSDIVETTVPVQTTAEAELTKLLENTFRHVNIALVNELARHARALGIDFWNVIDAAKTKPFGFMPFYPGPGVGGHCLPVDPSYLSWQFEQRLGTVSRFVKIANDINNSMPIYVAERIQAGLNQRKMPVNGSTILIIGLAYKKNSNDARETPATGLIRKLLSLGAFVKAYDPHVEEYELDGEIERISKVSEAELTGADAVVIVSDHDQIDYDQVSKSSTYVVDTRRRLTASPSVEHL